MCTYGCNFVLCVYVCVYVSICVSMWVCMCVCSRIWFYILLVNNVSSSYDLVTFLPLCPWLAGTPENQQMKALPAAHVCNCVTIPLRSYRRNLKKCTQAPVLMMSTAISDSSGGSPKRDEL